MLLVSASNVTQCFAFFQRQLRIWLQFWYPFCHNCWFNLKVGVFLWCRKCHNRNIQSWRIWKHSMALQTGTGVGGQMHSRITLGDAFAETFKSVFVTFQEFSCPSWSKELFKLRYCDVHAYDDFLIGGRRWRVFADWIYVHGMTSEISGYTNWDQGEPLLWKVNWQQSAMEWGLGPQQHLSHNWALQVVFLQFSLVQPLRVTWGSISFSALYSID